MAIFSLNHKPINKQKQDRPHTAAAHLNYITRKRALGRLDGARMPVSREGGAEFLRNGEDRDRKNGRVADKVMVALPKELTPEQRAELIRGYAEDMTQGKAPWIAATHDKGKDADNPHCHIIFRDRDPQTGRRVMMTSEPGSTERLRQGWERHANRALERAGRPERIDRRTLEAQGRQGPPGVHVGPKPRAMARKGRQPISRPRNVANGPYARRPSRYINYPELDRGRSRAARNAELAREREAWQAVDADRQARELDQLRRIHHPPAEQALDLTRPLWPPAPGPLAGLPQPAATPGRTAFPDLHGKPTLPTRGPPGREPERGR